MRESELTEDEVYQLSRRYRDRLKPIYLDVPVSEEVKKAQDELNEKYEFSDNRPQELIFIATRKHKKDEEHIYESWKTQFEWKVPTSAAEINIRITVDSYAAVLPMQKIVCI